MKPAPEIALAVVIPNSRELRIINPAFGKGTERRNECGGGLGRGVVRVRVGVRVRV